jgi:hypothetical protein
MVGAALEAFRVDALSVAALPSRRAGAVATTAMAVVEPVFRADAVAARCAEGEASLIAPAAIVCVTARVEAEFAATRQPVLAFAVAAEADFPGRAAIVAIATVVIVIECVDA